MLRVSFLLALVFVPALALADVTMPAPTRLTVDGRAVTVALEADDEIHVRVAGGGELVLEPAGRAYVARDAWNVTAELVDGVAPVPLVKVSSRPEACSDYWEIYVSVVGGIPRNALELDGLADPPSMSTPSVKFHGDGAVITQRTAEDEKHERTTRARYRWNGTVYESIGSKRASSRSK